MQKAIVWTALVLAASAGATASAQDLAGPPTEPNATAEFNSIFEFNPRAAIIEDYCRAVTESQHNLHELIRVAEEVYRLSASRDCTRQGRRLIEAGARLERAGAQIGAQIETRVETRTSRFADLIADEVRLSRPRTLGVSSF